MNWSVGQQAMLSEMGYTLYRQASAAPPPAPVAATSARPAAVPERLWDALVRAAGGRDPAPLLPPIEQLRAGAAAKRALWPALRALRRTR